MVLKKMKHGRTDKSVRFFAIRMRNDKDGCVAVSILNCKTTYEGRFASYGVFLKICEFSREGNSTEVNERTHSIDVGVRVDRYNVFNVRMEYLKSIKIFWRGGGLEEIRNLKFLVNPIRTKAKCFFLNYW